MRKNTRPKGGMRGQPRRRVVPLWRRRSTFVSALAVVLVGTSAAGWWAWREGYAARTADQLRWTLISASAAVGFTVDEVLVVGRRQTRREDLLSAVRLVRGAPLFAFDPAAAKERIEALPWVRSASVERLLPDTVFLRIEERRPLAIWQHKGRFSLIDRRGELITDKGLKRFSDLFVVVGADAPEKTPELLSVLSSQPQLQVLVKAAVRVGGRRWNVRLEGGIDVRLPEDNMQAAWARLAEYEKTYQVLARDVGVLDLRLPGRMIVRKSKRTRKPATGQDT